MSDQLIESKDSEKLLEEYSKLGWVREFEYRHISVNQGINRAVLQVYRVEARKLPCRNTEHGGDTTLVCLMPSGVMWLCTIDRIVSGPVSLENFTLISESPIAKSEAEKIMAETHQIKPFGWGSIGDRKKSSVIITCLYRIKSNRTYH